MTLHSIACRPLFVAFIGFALAVPAHAESRSHRSHGTAQFVSANDFIGYGEATHLGHYYEAGIIQFASTADPAVFQIEGCSIHTAANGDKLYEIFSGRLNLQTGAATATITYVGGTGRFVDASGTATLLGQLLPDGSFDIVGEGTIDY